MKVYLFEPTILVPSGIVSFVDLSQLKDFFHLCFCSEAAKKTSIDGLKWRDLVVVGW